MRTGVGMAMVGVVTLLLLGAASCTKSQESSAPVSTDPLVGIWETDPSPSQLGTVVTRYEFKGDGTFKGKVAFHSAPIPSWGGAGTYSSDGKTIRMTANGKETIATYVFEGAILVLTEGRDVFRLKRK